MQTSAAESQRRRSTFSCRMNLARIAEQIYVSDAEAGATRLASPQESAVSRQKKLKIRQQSPNRKSFSRTTWPTTASRPFFARISSRSPMRFIAAESITSPALEASTRMPMAVQSLSELMLLLLRGELACVAAFRQGRPARYQSYAAGNEQDAAPSPRAARCMQKNPRETWRNHVAERRCRQNV